MSAIEMRLEDLINRPIADLYRRSRFNTDLIIALLEAEYNGINITRLWVDNVLILVAILKKQISKNK